jgi:hypothetical protein
MLRSHCLDSLMGGTRNGSVARRPGWCDEVGGVTSLVRTYLCSRHAGIIRSGRLARYQLL